MKNIRNIPGNNVQDPGSIDAIQYNQAAGSKKVSEVGRRLLPIPTSATTWTTDASTVKALPKKGANLAVYNNSGSVGSVTLGSDGTVTSQSPGAVDSNGNPGIPCAANSWTYIACAEKNYVITSANTLLVFLIDDDTEVKQLATR